MNRFGERFNSVPVMRHTGIVGLTLLIAMGCSSPTNVNVVAVDPRTLILPADDSAAYRRDAESLAITQLQVGSPSSQRADVPPELVDQIYDVLASIYSARALPARDSVVSLFKIHAPPVARAISIGLDTTRAWTHAWQSGALHTGNAAVDALVARYGLRLGTYYASGPTVLLEPTSLTNVVPVAAAFARLDGVRYADPDAFLFNGGGIALRRTVFGWDVEFSYGAGDCPSGCLLHHHWSFAVERGRVVFKGSDGDR